MTKVRPSWNELFVMLAKTISQRSTCNKLQVGAVIVRDTHILSLGYNGSVAGAPHCTEAGCLIENNRCVRTLHAEVSAILNAGNNGISVRGANIYITDTPCFNCYRTIKQAGIDQVYYIRDYQVDNLSEMIKKAGLPHTCTKVDDCTHSS
jgi:dCMP deaminase